MHSTIPSLSRRGFVVSAAAAAAAFGLDGPLQILSPANAQVAGDPAAKGFARFKVGDWTVTTIYDGIWEKPHDPAFIRNATVEETKAALSAAGLPDAHVPITFTVTVAEKDGQTIMFDSGTGGQLSPMAGLLAKENLAKAGIDPAKISRIAVTHFHPDHIFGLMAKDTNEQVFPNAEIIVPEAEYKYWTDPALIETLPEARRGLPKRVQATFPTWKNIRQVADDAEIAPGLRVVNTNGHTPGHVAFELTSGDARLVVAGDIANIAALFVRNPGWHAVFDVDPAMAEQARRSLFERAVQDGAIVSGYHWGLPGAGTIRKDGDGYVLVPVEAT